MHPLLIDLPVELDLCFLDQNFYLFLAKLFLKWDVRNNAVRALVKCPDLINYIMLPFMRDTMTYETEH